MKHLTILLIILLLIGCTPVKYVMVDPKDSTKLVEVRKRIIYDDYYMHTPSLFYNNWWWYNSRPIIIQRPIVVPQRVQPKLPPRSPRPQFGPLPPTPRPRR